MISTGKHGARMRTEIRLRAASMDRGKRLCKALPPPTAFHTHAPVLMRAEHGASADKCADDKLVRGDFEVLYDPVEPLPALVRVHEDEVGVVGVCLNGAAAAVNTEQWCAKVGRGQGGGGCRLLITRSGRADVDVDLLAVWASVTLVASPPL